MSVCIAYIHIHYIYIYMIVCGVIYAPCQSAALFNENKNENIYEYKS